jgi:hypothetical protein
LEQKEEEFENKMNENELGHRKKIKELTKKHFF